MMGSSSLCTNELEIIALPACITCLCRQAGYYRQHEQMLSKVIRSPPQKNTPNKNAKGTGYTLYQSETIN